jgi:hypothetical protein
MLDAEIALFVASREDRDGRVYLRKHLIPAGLIWPRSTIAAAMYP